MIQFKNKFKKIFKKLLVLWVVVVLIFSCFTISASASVTQNGNITYCSSLADIFYNSHGDLTMVHDTPAVGSLSSPFLTTFEINQGWYTSTGNLTNAFDWSLPGYYTITIPFTFIRNSGTSVYEAYFYFIDKDYVYYECEVISVINPDTISNGNAVTYVFSITLSTEQLLNMHAFQLQFSGYAPSSNEYNNYIHCGLLTTKKITVEYISKGDYEVIWGEKGGYDINTGDTIARLDDVENQLFSSANLGGILSNVLSNGTWLADVGNGILASGMLFGELYNFGGTQYTWFISVIRFGLAIGTLALVLAIGPAIFGGFNNGNKGKKGGKGG